MLLNHAILHMMNCSKSFRYQPARPLIKQIIAEKHFNTENPENMTPW